MVLCRILALGLILGGMLSLPALAKTQKIGETPLPNGLLVHEYRMSNGLQILLVPDDSAPVFTFQKWFKVGSATEKLDPKLQRTGLAHLFEHMMFRGTKRHPDSTFDEKISAAGAVGNNATTWLDRTNYYESLPKERLELILDLESDRMVNLVLDEKVFKTELGAVFGEKKMYEDKPMRMAYHYLWDLAFVAHPYKYSTMGTTEELNSFTVEEARYFYKTYYAPNNATIILIGDIAIPKTLALLEKYYGKIPSQKIPAHSVPKEPEQKEARRKTVTHPLANADILLLSYPTPELSHPDSPALETLAALLAYGDGSLLEKNLVAKGIASTCFASAYKLRDPSLFMIGAQLVTGKGADDAKKVIQAMVKKVKKGDFTEADLTRAKNQFLLSTYMELGNQASLGESLGEALVSSDNFLANFQLLEAIKKVNMKDVIRVANTYLVDSRETELKMLPEKTAGKAQ